MQKSRAVYGGQKKSDTRSGFEFLVAGAGWPSRLTPLSWSRRFYPMLRIGAPRFEPASPQVQTLPDSKQESRLRWGRLFVW